jgi:hypothetical protein
MGSLRGFPAFAFGLPGLVIGEQLFLIVFQNPQNPFPSVIVALNSMIR